MTILSENATAEQSDLGKSVPYQNTYNPNALFAIPRATKREEINVDPNKLPFQGYDCWNHYEVSWLNQKGKPQVAVAEITYDCTSPMIVESKSLKLYFNSLNHEKFDNINTLETLIQKDLSKLLQTPVTITLCHLHQLPPLNQQQFTGTCLDTLDISCNDYLVDPSLLTTTENTPVTETVYSDLLKSNCLVTDQPDWGSVQITYEGNQINHEGLLAYIISFRNHNEFHEQCIERIFNDILTKCKPTRLTVIGRYTRRGGIDINPYRSTEPMTFANTRLARQ